MRRLSVIALLAAGVCYGQDIGMLAQYWTLLGARGVSYIYASTNYTWATGVSGVWSDTTKWIPATVAYPGYATNDAAWITNNAADFTVSVDVAPSNVLRVLTVSNNVGITTLFASNSLLATNITLGSGTRTVVTNGAIFTATLASASSLTVGGANAVNSSLYVGGTNSDGVKSSIQFPSRLSLGGTGAEIVVDQGGTMTNHSVVLIGAFAGHGAHLIVTNGGTAYSATDNANAYCGGTNIATGCYVVVTGSDSSGNPSSWSPGRFAFGTAPGSDGNYLIVTNGGQVNSTIRVQGFGTAWGSAGGNGNYAIITGTNSFGSNSTYTTASTQFDIGNGSTGNFIRVENGGVWNVGNAIQLGVGAGNSGNALIITNGGRVVFVQTANNIGNGGSNNVVIVTGVGATNSILTGSGTITMNLGTGSAGGNNGLIVSNGGRFSLSGLVIGNSSSNNGNYAIIDGATFGSSILTIGSVARSSNNVAIFQNGATGLVANTSAFGDDGNNNLCVVRDPGTILTNISGSVYIGNGSAANNNGLIVSNGANAYFGGTLSMSATAGGKGSYLIVDGTDTRLRTVTLNIGANASDTECFAVVTNGAFHVLGITHVGASGANNNSLYIGSEGDNKPEVTIGYNQPYGLTVGGSASSNNWVILDRGVVATGVSASQSGIMVGYAANANNNWALFRGAYITNVSSLQIGYAAGCRNNMATFDNATGQFVNTYLGNTGAGWNNTLLATNNSYLSLGATFSIGDEAGSSNNLATIDRSSAIATAINIGNGSGANNNGFVLTNGATLTQSGNMTLSATAGGIGCYLIIDGATGTISGATALTTHSNSFIVRNGSSLTLGSTYQMRNGSNNVFVVDRSSARLASTITLGAQAAGPFNLIIVTNGSSLTGTQIDFQFNNNGIIVSNNSSVNLSTFLRVAGESYPTNYLNSWYIGDGCSVTCATVYISSSQQACTNNTLLIDRGGLLQAQDVYIGNASSVGNLATNYGTWQIPRYPFTHTIVGSPNNGVVMMPGSFLSWAFTKNTASSMPSLTNNWSTDKTGAFIWMGTNSVRINSSFVTNGVVGGYTFSQGLGTTNFCGLEVVGSSGLFGAPVTVSADGSGMLSNTIFLCTTLTNAGPVTWHSPVSVTGTYWMATGSSNIMATAGATNFASVAYTNGAALSAGTYDSNSLPEFIMGGGYLRVP